MEGGLTLDSHSGWKTGGDRGPAIVPGKPDESLLIKAILWDDSELQMPPEEKLTEEEIALLTEWVERGAIDPRVSAQPQVAQTDWWSLQLPKAPEIPGEGHPLDAFIQQRLREKGLTSAPAADRATLIRRLYFDLHGLLPTPEEVTAFVEDKDPHAYEKLIDQLLDSPRYGERWARHWLDVVRFAETCGYERDQTKPFAWKYRYWVFNSFNSDKPYDEFIREQIAGDQMPDRSESTVIATGFLRLGTWNDEPNDPEDYKY
ncbi:MAG: DUF1549 domain-containing protein, partial [Planctomycetaceae bacterium]|nr:DUF1549 domain-containing protein [Planctomycetaceae bacterium]